MENEIKASTYRSYPKGLGLGITLMLIGLLFLGFNFGVIPLELKWLVFSWQSLLIFMGLVNLIKRRLVFGVLLVSVGSFFLLPKIIATYPTIFPGFHGDFTSIYWPLLLILAGVVVILGKTMGPRLGIEDWAHRQYHRNKHRSHFIQDDTQHNNGTGYKTQWNYSKGQNVGNGFSKSSIFGAGEHIVLDPVFKGGDMNAIFGGITLDLRKTTLAEGDTVLEVNAVFGGVTIIVPDNWLVETNIDAVFGGFEDKRSHVESIDSSRRLIITGSCVFGGGELRN